VKYNNNYPLLEGESSTLNYRKPSDLKKKLFLNHMIKRLIKIVAGNEEESLIIK